MSVSATTNGIRPGVCLSTDRPASPFIGQVIYMSDTDETAVWEGTYWEGLNRSRDRNVVINGAMQVAQRGTSVAAISATYNTADRWGLQKTNGGTWTQSVENDAPTGSGFRKSLKWLVTTAAASPAAGDILLCQQNFEGQNLQQFLKGTASAKQFTVSFWVKSNVTGTYVARMVDADNSRHVCATYSISASATWEKKTITFPADTTGAFDNDNAESLRLQWGLVAGSNFTSGTLATTWATNTSANTFVGQTNVAATLNNYWQITGVQLEAGSVATPFEFEDIQTTLNKCFRYFERYNESEYFDIPQHPTQIDLANRCEVVIEYSRKRAAPTLTVSNAAHLTCVGVTQNLAVAATTFGTFVGTGLYSTNIFVDGAGVNTFTVFHILFTNASGGWLAISAEL